ncbi:MAG: hypothetical protein JWO38_4580 [Gemmataceae bacterium]|nr:hypothetical protein [Gemmataceae bacterium]
MKTVPRLGVFGRAVRARIAGCTAAVGLSVAVVLAAGLPAAAQEREKGPPAKPAEVYQQFRALMTEGKYDVAALFLQSFLDSNPSDQDLLDIEARYGTTVFRQLRTVPKWSDDPKLDKQARATVEAIVKRATEATEKVLRNPARVNKYIRNLAETYEERQFAEVELRRTGDYAIPFMVDTLRLNVSPAVTAGIIGAIPKLEGPTMAGWVAALDGLAQDQQYGVLAAIASRPDVLTLLSTAQTDFIPYLWRTVGHPDASPALQTFARELLEKLVPGAGKRQPEAALAATSRTFADHKARYLNTTANPDGTPTTVPVWVWNAAEQKLAKTENVPAGQADEFFGLRYARWAIERRPDYEPAQVLVLTIATERAMDRGKFGELAKTDPPVYRMLADAPATVLSDLLDRSLAEKRTGVALALTQVLGDRADRGAASQTRGGKPSLLERGLDYPDPRVQLAAANALLRAPVPVDPKLRGRVIEVLKRAAAADAGLPAGAKGQALIADPNRQRADDTAVLLRGLGYDVEIFTAGRDLLRRVARASDFDLIVLDRHVPNPELLDLVSHLRADLNAARRPILVVASTDKPTPPSLDQLLLRFALLIAATETDPIGMPDPYVPNLRRPAEERDAERKTTLGRRDETFRSTARTRIERLQRVLDTTGLELTNDQKFQVKLRVEQVTYAVLAAEYPLTPESSPETYTYLTQLQQQIRTQPAVPAYTKRVGVDHLMKIAERLELDVSKAKATNDKYEALRSRVDTDALGLIVEPTRDLAAEASAAKLMRPYAAVRVIPEPVSRVWLESDINAVYADPADRPRDPAEKKAGAKLAVAWLAKMATGEVSGFDAKPAAAELIAALRVDDTADPAIDGVSRLVSADAQQALLTLALSVGRPVPVRTKAADAVIRHVQMNGKLVPQTLIDGLVERAGSEAEAELRSKFLVLKGLLASNPREYVTELRNYSPPLVPPPAPKPPAPMPEPKPKE